MAHTHPRSPDADLNPLSRPFRLILLILALWISARSLTTLLFVTLPPAERRTEQVICALDLLVLACVLWREWADGPRARAQPHKADADADEEDACACCGRRPFTERAPASSRNVKSSATAPDRVPLLNPPGGDSASLV